MGKTRARAVFVAAFLKEIKELLIVIANPGKSDFAQSAMSRANFGLVARISYPAPVLIGLIPGFRHGLPVSSLSAA
jgi:hypothetical protein